MDRLISAAASADKGAPSDKTKKAAEEFEAYMLKLLLGEMRKGGMPSGLFQDSASDNYRAMLDDALTRRAAEAGTFGLARQMLEQWEKP